MINSEKHIIWVDNDLLSQRDIQKEAEKENLILTPVDCWDDAMTLLSANYDKWSAIILEPKSKLHAGSYCNIHQFLPQAFSDMNVLMSKRGKVMPWYLLSSASPDEFIDMILESRENWDGDWQKRYYDKDSEEDRRTLFVRIREHCLSSNRIQLRNGYYKPVFEALEYLKDNGLNPNAEEIIEDMLLSLNSGTLMKVDFSKFRNFLECLFSSMGQCNLLPPIRNTFGGVNIEGCIILLQGRNYKDKGQKLLYSIKWPIMNSIMANNLFNIVKSSHASKHESSDGKQTAIQEYLSEYNMNNLSHSFALQICDVILWYEKLIRSLNDDPSFVMHLPWWQSVTYFDT